MKVAVGAREPWPGSATAQQATSMLVGRVVDEQGAVLPGVSVVVTNQDLGTSRTAVSNADGS